jgi:hypothetical protein
MAFDAAEDPRGGFVVAGRGPGSSGAAHVLRLDGRGNILWQTSFDSPRSDTATGVAPTDDRGFFVVGTTGATGGERMLLLKLDRNGRFGWQRVFDPARVNGKIPGFFRASSLARVPGGGFVVTGSADVNVSRSDSDLLVLRFDAAGQIPACQGLRDIPGSPRGGGPLPPRQHTPGAAGAGDVALNQVRSLAETGLKIRATTICAGAHGRP